MENKNFYDSVRNRLFNNSISSKQFEGMELTLQEAERRNLTDKRHIAYVLATEYHETDKTMQPIEEYGKGAKLPYGKRIKFSRVPYFDTQNLFYGRGHTQNTWYENYERLTKLAKFQGKDWDFIKNPELLLIDETSIWATFECMTKGLYTGKKLGDYFNNSVSDPVEARRIINGTRKGETKFHNGVLIADKADIIANYYTLFLNALQA